MGFSKFQEHLMATLYYDKAADLGLLKGKTIPKH